MVKFNPRLSVGPYVVLLKSEISDAQPNEDGMYSVDFYDFWAELSTSLSLLRNARHCTLGE